MIVDALSTFAKHAEKVLSPAEVAWLDDWKEVLVTKPYAGNHLGPFWFRELRHRSKRVYYIVGRAKVLLLDVSNKNTQDAVIRQIRLRLDDFKQVADE